MGSLQKIKKLWSQPEAIFRTHFKTFELMEEKKKTFICFKSWIWGNIPVPHIFLQASPLWWLPVDAGVLHGPVSLSSLTLFLADPICSHGLSF